MAGSVGSAAPAFVSTANTERGSDEGKSRRLVFGTLNARGCGADEKRCMITDMFKERKMDVLVLSETKVKGYGERDWEGEKVIISGVSERCRAREGVAMIIKEELWEGVIEYKCVSSRLMWVRMKVSQEKMFVVGVYGPGMERAENERDAFWDSLNECLSGARENERVIVLGDMNAKVGDQERAGVVGRHGVAGVNENGERLIEVCSERRMSVGNTWFEKRPFQKYTREGDNGLEKSLIDYVLVDERNKRFLEDVNVFRGAAGGISDHYLVEAKVRVRGNVRRERREVVCKKVIKVRELEKEQPRRDFQLGMSNEWERVKGCRVRSVEEEWELFKNAVLSEATRVCGHTNVGRKKVGSVWWDEEVKEIVREKKKLYENFIKDRTNMRNKDLYKRKNREVKALIREKKNESDVREGERLSRDFRENKKLYWSRVNGTRKVREQMSMKVKDDEGMMLTEPQAVRGRWSEYFERLLNVDDGRRAIISETGRESENVIEECEISVEEVREAVKKLKKGKSPGVDGVTSEILKCDGAVLEWLTRVCNVCIREEKVPSDWVKSIVVPLYKGKGDKSECKNYRGISLLSIPGKVYGRIIIDRVRFLTEGLIGEEQCGFRRGRGCVDQVFVMKQMSEKFICKNKELYVAFMDLEKAYDRIDRNAMWRVLRGYGVNGKLLRAVQCMYEGSEACVRVCREESEWFEVNVGLRQGCVMSPWLFNVYMDGVMKELRANVGEVGAVFLETNEGREWIVEWLMFADDTVLVCDSREKLMRLVSEFESVCRRRKLKVNVDKSKVMKIGRNDGIGELNVRMNGSRMGEVQTYRYLGVDIARDGKVSEELNHRIVEARKTWGALKDVWKKRNISVDAKVGMYEGIVEPTLVYGSETWVLNVRDRKRLEAVEMNCLRDVCGVRRVERVSNAEIRRRCGKNRGVNQKIDQGILRWFGHVERMGNERMVKRMYESQVRGGRGRGRPRKEWLGGVKEILERRGLSIQEAKVVVRDRNEWRGVCRG